jgi:tetratricopeptide (TPR) repeat protein
MQALQHTGAVAESHLSRQTRPGVLSTTPTASPAAPALDDAEQALAWARADRENLLACLDYVTRADEHARVTALTADLAELLRRDGLWADALIRHTTALLAARHLADRLGEANALTDLGDVRQLNGDYHGAVRDQEQALALYSDLGDRPARPSHCHRPPRDRETARR